MAKDENEVIEPIIKFIEKHKDSIERDLSKAFQQSYNREYNHGTRRYKPRVRTDLTIPNMECSNEIAEQVKAAAELKGFKVAYINQNLKYDGKI